MQSRLGNHERNSVCDWNSRLVDCAVFCRIGNSCGSPFDPCAVGGLSLAGFERDSKDMNTGEITESVKRTHMHIKNAYMQPVYSCRI